MLASQDITRRMSALALAIASLHGAASAQAPARGGDPEDMFPVRVLSYGFDAEGAR